jgi:HEAT repeat protein
MASPLAAADTQVLIKQMTGQKAAPSRDQQAWQVAYTQVLDHLIPTLAHDQRPKRYTARMTLEAMTRWAHRADATTAQRALSKVLTQRLVDPSTPMPARLTIAQKLINFAEGDAVPALSKLLDAQHERLAERVRRALAHNPSDAARQALADALKQAKEPAKRLALIQALAQRRSSKVAPILMQQLQADDTSVVVAALNGLGEVGDQQTLSALAKQRVPEAAKAAKARATLHVASRLAEGGRFAAAEPTLARLHTKGPTAAIRAAALKQRLLHGTPHAGQLYTRAIQGNDPALQKAAIQAARHAAGSDVTRAVMGLLDTVPPLMQQRLLHVLAERADPVSESAITALIDAQSPDDMAVQQAAVRALAALNTVSVAETLLPLVRSDNSTFAQTARDALAGMNDADVVSMLHRRVKAGEPQQRNTAMIVLDQRGERVALKHLFRALSSDEPALQHTAQRLLVKQARPNQIKRLLGRLGEDESPRTEAVLIRAIRSALRHANRPGAYEAPMLTAYAGLAAGQKAALLPAFHQLGSEAALKRVTEALGSDHEKLQKAAIATLGNWANLQAAQPLLDQIQADTNAIAASNALPRLANLVRGAVAAPAWKRARLLKRALAMADDAGTQKALLSALGTVADPQALALAQQYLGKQAVRQEAGLALLQIAEQLYFVPERTEATINQLAGDATSKALRDRAKTILQKDNALRFAPLPPSHLSSGADADTTGWQGQYHNTVNLDQQRMKRVDQVIAFDWGQGKPAPKLGADNFSMRWQSILHVPATGQYTLAVRHDDGARLWVDGEKVIDGWSDGPARVSTAQVQLSKGDAIPLKLEYYERGQDAVIQLGWRGPMHD